MTAAQIFLGIMAEGGGWKDRKAGDVLGKDPKAANKDDLRALSFRETLRLFHALPPANIESLSGEYVAEIIPAGVFAPLAAFFTHTFFGPGRWQGKAFRAISTVEGEGYNIFSGKNGEGVRRVRRFKTCIALSRFDGKPSFQLDYGPFNGGLVKSMRDELRQVNSGLFLGLGVMASGGGAINPAPFLLAGYATPWKGPE